MVDFVALLTDLLGALFEKSVSLNAVGVAADGR